MPALGLGSYGNFFHMALGKHPGGLCHHPHMKEQLDTG